MLFYTLSRLDLKLTYLWLFGDFSFKSDQQSGVFICFQYLETCLLAGGRVAQC